jgi:hypothetical protein
LSDYPKSVTPFTRIDQKGTGEEAYPARISTLHHVLLRQSSQAISIKERKNEKEIRCVVCGPVFNCFGQHPGPGGSAKTRK